MSADGNGRSRSVDITMTRGELEASFSTYWDYVACFLQQAPSQVRQVFCETQFPQKEAANPQERNRVIMIKAFCSICITCLFMIRYCVKTS